MFEKLYSENLIAKLKKIPVFVWYLFFGIASSFASLYALINLGPEYLNLFAEQLPELNTQRFLYIFYPATFILDIVIFELVAYLIYSLIAKRFFVEISQFDFVFRLRLTMIILYFIIGLVSLIYFAFPQAQMLMSSILNPAVQSVFLAFFMYEICKNYVRSGVAHKAFLYIARFYLTIVIVFNIINLVSLFTVDNSTVMEYVSYSARLAVYLLASLLAYVLYKKLKSIPPKDEDNNIIKEEEQVVFKDFGF